jgi:hypothetical protein
MDIALAVLLVLLGLALAVYLSHALIDGTEPGAQSRRGAGTTGSARRR